MDYKKPPAIRRRPPMDDHGQPLPSGHAPSMQDIPPGLGAAIKNVFSAVIVTVFLISVLPLILDHGGKFVMPFLLLVLAAVIFIRNVVIVPQGNAYVIERLGKYATTWEAGLHIKIPFIDRIVNRVSLKEQVLDFPPQAVITKDNVSMQIDTVVYLKVLNPHLCTYGVSDPMPAVENLTATTLRNIIGGMTLEEALTGREVVNTAMQASVDEATDPWGLKISRIELKNIMPPRDIQEAMEKQMRAEREKREAILRAEGAKESRILEATGLKEATILEAEANKQKMILEAEAERDSAVARSAGEAESIRKVKAAEADGIKMIKEAAADASVIQLESLETLKEMARGPATTFFIPSDLAGTAGSLAVITEGIKKREGQS